MAAKKDFYEILGVSKTATEAEIKTAYRTLVKKYHPDVNKAPDAEERFKEVQSAYEVLSTPDKRASYDQFGHAAFDQQAGFGGGGFSGFDAGDLGDIFSSFFGGFTGGNRQKSRGSDTAEGNDRYIVSKITFMEAVNGATKSMTIPVEESCIHCGGSGAESRSDMKTCTKCNGHGVTITQQRTIFGVMQSESTCPECGGKGKVITKKCTHCKGQGYQKETKTFDVNIPEGINNGQQIRIKGKGERGSNGGPNGDLLIEIQVLPHQHFKRDGSDIHLEVPLSFVDATLGTKIDVPGLHGDISVNIAEGSQPDTILRIKGKGIKNLRTGGYGDQYLHLKLETPTKLSKEEKEMLEKFRTSEKASKETIFDKFKKMFKK